MTSRKVTPDQVLPINTVGDQDTRMSYLIDAHLAHLRASGQSQRTIGAREEVLRRLHAYLPMGLAWATTDEIERWLGNEQWSAWTRATYAMHIRGFYRWAAGRYLDGDPTAEMARPRHPQGTPEPVTDEELALALERSRDPWYTAILLAAYEGLRVSEIARLRREDVTEESIRVIGKGGDTQRVDTHPIVWAHVKDRPSGPLVTDYRGRPVTGRWLSAHARHHFDAIGLLDVHMHRFRHWFGTRLLESGASMRIVQEAMRHRSVTSTQIYTAVSSGQRRTAIRSLPTPPPSAR